MPQEIKTKITDAMAAKIEAAGKRLNLSSDQVLSLGLLIAAGYSDPIRSAERRPDIRAQLKDILDLHRYGKLSQADLIQEVRSLIDLDEDDSWSTEA